MPEFDVVAFDARRNREGRTLRNAIWSSVRGCACPTTIDVNGREVRPRANERCTSKWVRCNERMGRILDELKSHGLRIGPVEDGEAQYEPREEG